MDDDFDQYDEEEGEPLECDCLDADVDILTGREHCYSCGSSRYLSGDEFELRMRQQAEWEAAYHEEIAATEPRSN